MVKSQDCKTGISPFVQVKNVESSYSAFWGLSMLTVLQDAEGSNKSMGWGQKIEDSRLTLDEKHLNWENFPAVYSLWDSFCLLVKYLTFQTGLIVEVIISHLFCGLLPTGWIQIKWAISTSSVFLPQISLASFLRVPYVPGPAYRGDLWAAGERQESSTLLKEHLAWIQHYGPALPTLTFPLYR